MSEAYRVDLTNCDREPIHILGAIQPIGFLVAMSRDWVVTRASANSEMFIGRSPDALIGRQITDVFTRGSAEFTMACMPPQDWPITAIALVSSLPA